MIPQIVLLLLSLSVRRYGPSIFSFDFSAWKPCSMTSDQNQLERVAMIETLLRATTYIDFALNDVLSSLCQVQIVKQSDLT